MKTQMFSSTANRALLSLATSFLAAAAAVAAPKGSTVEDEIAAYGRLDYEHTITIGRRVVRAHPDDGSAHYYLAGAYVKEWNWRQAYEEYKACLRVTTDPLLRRYCQEAIEAFESRHDDDVAVRVPALPAAPAPPPRPPEVSLKKAEKQRDEKLRMLQAELDATVRNIDDLARAQTLKVNSDLNFDLANLPVGGSRHGGGTDYLLIRKALQDEAASKIENIRMNAEHDRNAVQVEFRRRDANIRELVPNEISQLQPGRASDIQLTAQGTDLYIRNFVNYGGGSDSEPPPAVELRATALTIPWAGVASKSRHTEVPR